MYSNDGTSEQDLITLRVADPERSRGFYQDLFGLVPVEDGAGDGDHLRGPDNGWDDLVLQLVEAPGEAVPELWLSVEVGSVTEVLDLYLLAIMIGARASLPRKRGDRWNTVVADPDGHHISIWTSVPRESPGPGEAPTTPRRSPRWEWERSQRPGYEAGRVRDQDIPGECREGAAGDAPGAAPSRSRGEAAPARDRATGVP